MKKKLSLMLLALGALLFASCDNVMDLINPNLPRNFEFSQAELNADAAEAGATAGSFSAEGGKGGLSYRLVRGYEDGGKFAVEGDLLKIRAESLGAGVYRFRAMVEDQEGGSAEQAFVLEIAPGSLRLGFAAAALSANAAIEGAVAGSFSAEGETGGLAYSLVAGVDDYDKFAVEGRVLKILAESLSEGEYYFRARAESSGGRSVEEDFILAVAPLDEPTAPDGPSGPDNPLGPEAPAVPGAPAGPPDTPTQPEDPDAPDVPQGPDNPGGPSGPSQPNVPGTPGTPETPEPPATPVPLAKPSRAVNLSSKVGMQHVVLSWTAASRAETYVVYYNTAADFASAAKFALEPAEPEIMITGLRDGKTYSFWVVAKNAAGAADPSRTHTASQRTSDPIPEYLRIHLIPGGPMLAYSASNLWPGGDYYTIQDLGEDRLAHERYLFGYGAGSTAMGALYPGGTLKFVRNFNPPEDYETAGPNANYEGCLIYAYETTENGERINKYQAVYYQGGHLGPQTYLDYQNHPSHPPAANMGTANDYASGVGETTTYTLERAIVLYAHRGGGPRGTGGRSDYLSPMAIYYGYDPTVVGN